MKRGLTYEEAIKLGLGDEHPDAPKNKAARKHKYGAVPTEYRGVRYDSKAEANHARGLDLDIAVGVVAWWVRQVTFTLGVPENRMVVDFLVVCPRTDGFSVRVDEVKGRETEKYRHCRRLWEAYGPCELRVIRNGRVAEIIIPKSLVSLDA